MNRLLFIIGLIILFTGCVTPSETSQEPSENITTPEENLTTTQPPPTPPPAEPEETPFDKANRTAYDFAEESSTYAYDGSGLTLKSISGNGSSYSFEFTYISSYSGFGDRSAYKQDAMPTYHTLIVKTDGSTVASAILDGVYDEKAQGWIDLTDDLDLTPKDRNRSIQIALDYMKGTDYYKEYAVPGSDVWLYSADQMSDTAYLVAVRFEAKPVEDYSKHRWYGYITVNNYRPFLHNQTLIYKQGVNWFSDPTTDYSQVTGHIPDPDCPGNQEIAANLTYKFCYEPTSTDGDPCSKSEDCERGACIRTSSGSHGPPALCKDYPFGCRYWLYGSQFPLKVCMD